MIGSLSASWLLYVWLFGVASTLAHELGHASLALRYTNSTVTVQVGPRRGALRGRLGRLELSLSPLGPGGFCSSATAGLARGQRLAGVLAGPAVNLVLSLVLLVCADAEHGSLHLLLFAGFEVNAYQGILNLLPRHSRLAVNRGLPSDGLTALNLLRGKMASTPPRSVVPLAPAPSEPAPCPANPLARPPGDASWMKVCPACAAEVQPRAKLCFCNYAFD